MTRIGFVLLTHACPEQTLELVKALNRLYDGPLIACHHDFGQCPLDRSVFPDNVTFVNPHFTTFWGCFSIIPAALAGLRTLMEGKNPPDWVYLLSGSDYPTASSDEVRRLLAGTEVDAFIDHRRIDYNSLPARDEPDESTGFKRRSYLRLAYQRYCAVAVPRPGRDRPWAFPPVGHSYLFHPWWRAAIPSPFSKEFSCYAGEHWFTVNSRAAAVLLDCSLRARRLLAHLRKRESPEECFYHSILGNAPLRLSANNLRYIHWPAGSAWHPSTLSLEHLPEIRVSGAHFARKVAYDSPLISELDRLTGIDTKSLQSV